MNAFSTVGLIARLNDHSIADTLEQIVTLLHRHGITVLAEHSTKGLLDHTPTVDLTTIGQQADLCIVIGGDGTLLHAARTMVDHQVPLVGVNRGRLGFLVDVSPEDKLHQLEEILSGHYQMEQRFMLECSIHRGGEIVHHSYAFNDLVLKVTDKLRIIEFETRIDGVFVNRLRADGLIVSTPSGSTAYALSNGGPIIHPGQSNILVLAICPHTLSSRPLLIGSESKLDIRLRNREPSPTQITADGQVYFDVDNDDIIRIQSKQERLTLLHPQDYDFYELLRAKLSWS